MKIFKELVGRLMAPRIISDDSRRTIDPIRLFFDKVVLPVIIPGYVRPVVKLQKIDKSSSRRNAMK